MPFRFYASLVFVLWLAACGGTAASSTIPEPIPSLSPQAALGKAVFTRECGSCHSLSPDTVIVGPSLAGVAARAENRVPGQDAHTYLLTSILQPGGYLVPGFEDLMPANFGKKLTGEEIDTLVAYLATLQ